MITTYCPSVATLSKLQSVGSDIFSDPERYADEVIILEQVDSGLVSEWIIHRALAMCNAKVSQTENKKANKTW